MTEAIHTQLPDGRYRIAYRRTLPEEPRPAALVMAGSPPGLLRALAESAARTGDTVPVVIEGGEPLPGGPPDAVHLRGAGVDDDVWALVRARWTPVGLIWAGGGENAAEELEGSLAWLLHWARSGLDAPLVVGVADQPPAGALLTQVAREVTHAGSPPWTVLGHPGVGGLVGGGTPAGSVLEQMWRVPAGPWTKPPRHRDAYAHVEDVARAYLAAWRHLAGGGGAGLGTVGLAVRFSEDMVRRALCGTVGGEGVPVPLAAADTALPLPPARSWAALIRAVCESGEGGCRA